MENGNVYKEKWNNISRRGVWILSAFALVYNSVGYNSFIFSSFAFDTSNGDTVAIGVQTKFV